MPSVRTRTRRPRGALLQLDIESDVFMCSIGGRLRNRDASFGGVTGEIPPLSTFYSSPGPQIDDQALVGSFRIRDSVWRVV